MKLNKIILEISLGGDNNKKLINAIKGRKKISFKYYGPRKPEKISVKPGSRYLVEPVTIGLTKKGYMAIKGWVSDTSSVTKTGFAKHQWRTFLVSRMKGLTLTDDIFNEPPPGYKEGDDPSFSTIYYKVNFGERPEEKPTEPKPEVEPEVEPTKPAAAPTEPTAPEIEPTIAAPEPEIEPTVEPHTEPEAGTENLPQPKPIEKPTVEPEAGEEETEPEGEEEEEENNLQENIKRIKSLMLF